MIGTACYKGAWVGHAHSRLFNILVPGRDITGASCAVVPAAGGPEMCWCWPAATPCMAVLVSAAGWLSVPWWHRSADLGLCWQSAAALAQAVVLLAPESCAPCRCCPGNHCT